MNQIPVIDLSPLILNQDDLAKHKTSQSIGYACRHFGFFYISGHGIPPSLEARLESLSKAFFELPLETKMKIHMSVAGRAWRGYFPFGNELTGGLPDQKEGLYFGEELSIDHPLVLNETPLHGPNLFPEELPEFRQVIIEYEEAMSSLGNTIMRGIALSLGLPEDYFFSRYTRDPTVLFQIMHYPPAIDPKMWAISEHTDYGILTILKQDQVGGLQIKVKNNWIDAAPIDGTFVCNLGDMLDRMTGGLYKSTPHRVNSPINQSRLSYPFFFDPNFHVEVRAISELGEPQPDDKNERWDKQSVHMFRGTYGDYILKKVSLVFPNLMKQVFV